MDCLMTFRSYSFVSNCFLDGVRYWPNNWFTPIKDVCVPAVENNKAVADTRWTLFGPLQYEKRTVLGKRSVCLSVIALQYFLSFYNSERQCFSSVSTICVLGSDFLRVAYLSVLSVSANCPDFLIEELWFSFTTKYAASRSMWFRRMYWFTDCQTFLSSDDVRTDTYTVSISGKGE